jgi:hypothetical protein
VPIIILCFVLAGLPPQAQKKVIKAKPKREDNLFIMIGELVKGLDLLRDLYVLLRKIFSLGYCYFFLRNDKDN